MATSLYLTEITAEILKKKKWDEQVVYLQLSCYKSAAKTGDSNQTRLSNFVKILILINLINGMTHRSSSNTHFHIKKNQIITENCIKLI